MPEFWDLPHDVRRTLFSIRNPRRAHHYRKLRTSNDIPSSLMPFDRFHCIFVHVPKTAGSSVAQSLFGQTGIHLGMRSYSLIYKKHEFYKYFKFAFVRNPWDRLLSAFTYLKAGSGSPEDRSWAEANLTDYPDFESFVTDWVARGNIDSYVHLIPQYKFLRVRGERPAVDFIGRMETIERDFETIRERLGIATELVCINRSTRRKDYREAYTEEMREIVGRAYRTDIELFGYQFEGLPG